MARTKKSTTPVERKSLNPDYYDAVSDLIDICNRMFQSSTNQFSELFRIGQIVGFFARQIAYLDTIRQQFAHAKQTADLNMLQNVAYKVENSLECKIYDDLWSTISHMYDDMIASLRQESANDELFTLVRSSEEIMENSRKYYAESKEDKAKQQIETIETWLNL